MRGNKFSERSAMTVSYSSTVSYPNVRDDVELHLLRLVRNDAERFPLQTLIFFALSDWSVVRNDFAQLYRARMRESSRWRKN